MSHRLSHRLSRRRRSHPAHPAAGQLTSVADQHAALREEHSRASSALAKLEADHCIAEANLDRLDKDLTALRRVRVRGAAHFKEMNS